MLQMYRKSSITLLMTSAYGSVYESGLPKLRQWDCRVGYYGDHSVVLVSETSFCQMFLRHIVTQLSLLHYDDVIMGAITSQITSLTIVYSTVISDADQRKHQSSASLAFVPGIHRGPVNSPHKWPVTRKMFPFDDVIMTKLSVNLQTITV